MKELTRLRSVAAAGNAAALVLLVLVLAHHLLLFGQLDGPPPKEEPEPGAVTGGPVLLVVIDGLRRDGAPALESLAWGAIGRVEIESLVPSTVAGIRSLAEGVVPPPGSFFSDFGASRSRRGGIFAAARQAGIATFVAGPHLWSDLYGPWLTGSFSVESVTGQDDRVLQAGLKALRSGRYGLMVVHLNGPDDAAHLAGGRSEEYRRALTSVDKAVGRLVAATAPGTTVVVTADHGVTDAGGHAGPEEEVLSVPLVVLGPTSPEGYLGTIDLGTVLQREVQRFVLGALGLEPLPSVPPVRRPGPLPALITLLGMIGSLSVGSLVLRGSEGPRAATWLDAGLWVGLALTVAGWRIPALIVALGVPVWIGSRERSRTAFALCSAAMAAGGIGGALRVLDGSSPVPAGWALPLAGVAGVAGGLLCGRGIGRHPLLTGVAAALLPALIARLAGETASLSTLDVRLAFRIVDGPAGLAGAALVAALRQALPALAVLAGLAPALARIGEEGTARFAAGLGAALAGQALAAGLVLLLAPEALPLASRSVGLLARLAGEITALFLGCALALAVAGVAGARHARG